MSFTKGMAASNQRQRLFVIHRHPPKGFANVFGSR